MGDLRQWFNQVDSDRSGTIEAPELQKALALGRLNLSLFAVAQMLRGFDEQKRGCLDYPQYCQLHQFLIQTQQTFHRYDRGRGEISKAEAQQALGQAGYVLDQPAFNALFASYDPDQNNLLGLPEWLALNSFVRSAAKTYEAFRSMSSSPQGTISLNYCQWVYAASSTV